MKIILTPIISLLVSIFFINTNYANNTYTNYQNTSLITVRLSAAYNKGNSTFSSLNLNNRQNGFDVMVDTNIFYNINFLHNFYFGGNVVANNGVYLDNNMLMGVVSYNVLLEQPKINLNVGFGIGKINVESHIPKDCMECNFKFYNTNAKQVFFNVGYFGKKLGCQNFGIYGGMKIIFSNYQENSYNGMVNRKYYNYLVGVGFIYKVSFFI